MKIPDWTREPLVHFLCGGAVIFAVFAWIGEPADPASREIVVDREQQAQIALQFGRTMQRPPMDAEFAAQIDRWLRDEILYREALRLGLDQGDAVVRRRLAQKMDFIAASQAEAAMPDDAVLQDWLAKRPARFSSDPKFTFDQLWFADQADAQAALKAVSAAPDWRELGEPISLPASFDAASRNAVAAQLGREFTRELGGLEASGEWGGPMASGLGWHLIRLRETEAGSVPPWADIRDDVLADWRSSTAKDRREQAYALLRDAYTIEVEAR